MPRRAPVSTPAWGLDAQVVARLQRAGCLRLELVAVQEVAAGPARLAARRTRRRVPAPLGDQGEAHLVERLQLAHDAVAAVVIAAAAGASSHGVLDRSQRELQLERLDRRVEGVAHR